MTIAKANPDATRSALINGFKDIEEILIRRWPEHKSEKQKLETRLDSKLLAGLSRTCKRILAQKLYITPALHRTDSGIDSPGWYQHQIESAWDGILSAYNLVVKAQAKRLGCSPETDREFPQYLYKIKTYLGAENLEYDDVS